MGFFDALKRVLIHDRPHTVSEEKQRKIREAWGLDDEGSPGAKTETAAGASASGYDRAQWEKKLRRILDELPDSQREWNDLISDAQALALEADWIAEQQREAFAFLIRQAVADRVVTEKEHEKLDQARKLIGLSEAEAEKTLHAIMAEAEAFFGKPVKDEA